MDFGEIATAPSRAFWDDYEDFETNGRPAEKITLDYGQLGETQVKSLLAAADTLLVIEGPAVRDFVTSAIVRCDSAAKLLFTATAKCELHLLADGQTLVLLSEVQDLMQFAAITELLRDLLERIRRVVTISVESAVAYKSDERAPREPCFVRRLVGGGAEPEVDVPVLAEPNFVTGVAAGVASYRQFIGQPWTSLVAYVNEPALNSLTTAPILRLIGQLGIARAAAYSQRAANESNLYT